MVGQGSVSINLIIIINYFYAFDVSIFTRFHVFNIPDSSYRKLCDLFFAYTNIKIDFNRSYACTHAQNQTGDADKLKNYKRTKQFFVGGIKQRNKSLSINTIYTHGC